MKTLQRFTGPLLVLGIVIATCVYACRSEPAKPAAADAQPGEHGWFEYKAIDGTVTKVQRQSPPEPTPGEPRD